MDTKKKILKLTKTLFILSMVFLSACSVREQNKEANKPTYTNAAHTDQPQKNDTPEALTDTMAFLSYDDDGDYYFITAEDKNGISHFINDGEHRDLWRGDRV